MGAIRRGLRNPFRNLVRTDIAVFPFTMEGEWRLTVRIIQTDKPLKLSFVKQVGP